MTPTSTPETDDSQPFSPDLAWTDGRQRIWRIEPSPAGVTLSGPHQQFSIPIEKLASDLYVSLAGEGVVVRFAGPTEDVGFLVSRSEATRLLHRLGARLLTPEEEAAQAPRPAPSARPFWPKMTATAVWALIASSLAFLPVVGVLFAVATLLLVLWQRRRVRGNPAWLHVRWMHLAAISLAAWGLIVWAAATWTWLLPVDWQVSEGSAVLAGPGAGKWQIRILSILVVVLSLSVHEAAHAVAAWWCGDDFARSQGRVTLNPLAHIDPIGTVLLPLLLAVAGAPAFGYARPVPTRLEGLPNYRRAQILVSIAGPGSNLLLAAVFLSLLLALGCALRPVLPTDTLFLIALVGAPSAEIAGFPGAEVLSLLVITLKLGVIINLFLAMFNLIPIPPLDGSWVLQNLFPRTLGPVYAMVRPFGFLIILLLMSSDSFSTLMKPADNALTEISRLMVRCLTSL